MDNISTRASRAFSPIGRFFSTAADSIARARLATELLNTPDSVFTRSGLTRDQAMRRVMGL